MPTRIQFGAGNSISYLYDADGVKLRTTYVIDGVTKILGILQDNGRFMHESLLMGPNGGLKVQSILENNRLITVELFGGK